MVDTSKTPALGYMEVVPDRTAATLLPIIQSHVANGTIIHSDKWRAYQSIQQTIPQVSSHETVNHSVEFVSSTGVHTQHIESYWNRSKTRLKTMKGCRSEKLPEYLDEFMWKERVPANSGDDLEDILEAIFSEIRSQYPVRSMIVINESRIP